MIDAGVGNSGGERDQQAPLAPNDASQVDHQPVAAPQVEAPAPAEPAEPTARLDPRDAIAAAFKARRQNHDSQFDRPEHVPPFVEQQERAAPAPSEQPAPVQPAAPAAPAYTLKVRGREIPVPNRSELIRLTEAEPHEIEGFTDDMLVRLAQKQVAGSVYVEETRTARDQARVAAPAPAAPQAGQPPQQPAAPAQQAPSLIELRMAAIETTQLGDAKEANQAWQRYEDARDAYQAQQQDATSRQEQMRRGTENAVRSFSEKNQDIVTHPAASDLLLMSATREMGNDLRALGLTEQELGTVLNNPKEMADAYNFARQNGFQTRSNDQILEAAGANVRAHFPALRQAAAPAPNPTAAPSRLDEKRGLTAQPSRSGNPLPTPHAPVDQIAKRQSVIAERQAAMKRPNVNMG